MLIIFVQALGTILKGWRKKIVNQRLNRDHPDY